MARMIFLPLVISLLSTILLHSGMGFSPHAYQLQRSRRVSIFVHTYMRSQDEPKEKSLVDKVLRLDQANVFQSIGRAEDNNIDGVDYDDDPDSNPFLEWVKKVSRH